MTHGICVSAPAKLNIHLRVYPKRADGYHNIESIFQKISLSDELFVKLTGCSQRLCTVITDGMDLPEQNTVTRAYELFTDLTGIKDSVCVRLTKRIPSGAGMGGGSSDGAAMLQALNELFAAGLTTGQLHSLAEKIGSDVPFFLYEGAALVEGRGEIITTIAARKDLFFVVVCPDVHSSTKEAFHLFDDWCCASSKRVNWPSMASLASMYEEPVKNWCFTNSFTEPLISAFPIIGLALDDLRLSGARYSSMTGSGSSVFGIFPTIEEAQIAHARLNRKWRMCSYSTTL